MCHMDRSWGPLTLLLGKHLRQFSLAQMLHKNNLKCSSLYLLFYLYALSWNWTVVCCKNKCELRWKMRVKVRTIQLKIPFVNQNAVFFVTYVNNKKKTQIYL